MNIPGITCRVCLGLVLFAVPSLAPAQLYDKYLWETPRVAKIDPIATADLTVQVEREVNRILDAGPLAPLRLSYADIPYEAYWLYYERGRIVTTLSYAYPHVAGQQQDRIRSYVRRLLADPRHTPYEPGIIGPTDGASRALHGRQITEGRYITHYGQPTTLHVLYGLWLYGDRTGDWDALKPYWSQIKTRYLRGIEKEPILYGQMGAHIAVARLARRFGDADLLAQAREALIADLKQGQDITRIVDRLQHTRFAHFHQPRNRGSFPGDCWVFLDACPEILRFLDETNKQEVLRRTGQIKSRYPLWWLHQAPYFTRWTGDEGVGVTPELIGMVFPIERWVAKTEASRLARFMRSTPVGIGDCYWIESLAQTIEAFGHLEWKEID